MAEHPVSKLVIVCIIECVLFIAAMILKASFFTTIFCISNAVILPFVINIDVPVSFDTYHFTLVLVAVITSVIAPVLLQFVRYALFTKSKDNKKEDVVISKLKREGIITDRLEKIRKKYNVDRVWVAIFHNGSHTFTGKSMQKFSLTFESVKSGVSIEGPNTQNLPTSLFSSLFNQVALHGLYRVVDTTKSDDMHSSSLQGFFESRGIKSFLAVSILDIKDNIVGILGIDSTHEIITLSDRDIETIKYDTGIIAGYLE